MTCSLHLVDDLRSARSELLAACAGVPDAGLRRRPDKSGWAIIELLAHLPDVDRHYLAQAQQLRGVPGHTFVYFDEEAWARDHADVIGRDPRAVKLAMAAAHQDVVRWTDALTPEELACAGGHPRRESISVRQMIERIVSHDRTHTQQAVAIRQALAGG